MKNKHLLFCFLIIASTLTSCQYDKVDLIIRNGLIVDGTGSPGYSGSIAVNHDAIYAIGELSRIKGKVEVNADGKIISPGFINMLSWANESLIEDGRSQGDIRQGVTLEVMGEGSSMGPLNDALKKEMIESQEDIKFDIEWNTLGEYLVYLESRGVSTNVASFVGNATLRQYVMGYENRPPTPEEMGQMKALLIEAMEEGAMGLSSSLIYVPSGHADTNELIELARVAALYDGMYISHIRGEESDLLEAVEELIKTAREANIRSEIYHFKASGTENWHLLDTAIAMIEQARAEGLMITTDMYTYHASSTGLNIGLPLWAREGGHESTMELIHDPGAREKMIRENVFHVTPDDILLVGFKNSALRKYLGKTLEEVSVERGKSPSETAVDLIFEDNSRIQVVYFSMSENNIKKKIALPYMSICSDAGSYTADGVFLNQSTHPRAYGSFARVLGKYVREENVISLEEGVYKMTGLPANNLRLEKRGLLKTGYFADIVIFDPETIRDHATFKKPHQYATGVVHVWVNGEQVIRQGEHTGAFPGRFVRGPGYKLSKQ
jgi:N-acyl-D-amino-acid deacylase